MQSTTLVCCYIFQLRRQQSTKYNKDSAITKGLFVPLYLSKQRKGLTFGQFNVWKVESLASQCLVLFPYNDCRCHCFVVHDGRLILFLMQCSQQEIIFHLPIHQYTLYGVPGSQHNTTNYNFQLRRQPPPPTCARPGCQLTESLLHTHSQAVSQAASEAAPAGTGAVHRPGPPSSPVLLPWSEGGGCNLDRRGLRKATAIYLLSQYHLRAAHEYLCVSANTDLPRALIVGKG